MPSYKLERSDVHDSVRVCITSQISEHNQIPMSENNKINIENVAVAHASIWIQVGIFVL